MIATESFHDFVVRATGFAPYPYQCRLGESGLPDLLKVPTGAGKTLAATLPWLYRRRVHPDAAVRSSTPHWLVFVLPMRVLVEQTNDAIAGWLERLGLAQDVGLQVVMGGAGRLEAEWRRYPERDSILVGTLDMLLSRALNRGYASNRFVWPIDFGLFNAGCQWVFDEIQLMGPALPTSRQLEGLRRKLGTTLLCRSMWMSATVDERSLGTVDLPELGRVVELEEDDRRGGLRGRLEATKTVRRLAISSPSKTYQRELAAALLERHRAGTLSIAMLNTVEGAKELRNELMRIADAEIVLLHSRFRPADRRARVHEALGSAPSGLGRIIVSTQVLEAGVDVSADVLFTEAAPWPSIVQRAGRCNRDGRSPDAELLWAEPPSAGPYESEDLDASVEALSRLEGQRVNPIELGGLHVALKEVVHPVLRRVDLLGLFDTTPDLSGDDIDVSRFIRSTDDVDVQVAWRALAGSDPTPDQRPLTRDEFCPVPIGQVRTELGPKGRRSAWRYDHLAGAWVTCSYRDVRPGHVILLRADEGGYDPLIGWDPGATAPVEVVADGESSPLDETEEATEADAATYAPGSWVPLIDHLRDVERALREMASVLGPEAIPADHLEAAALAARLHDLGKAHPVFQQTLIDFAPDEDAEMARAGGPWAKARSKTRRTPHARRYFRHELVSALALLENPEVLVGLQEKDLAVYLVAAHHGRVRVGIRSLPDETRPNCQPDRRVALGVWDGEAFPQVAIPGGQTLATELDLAPMEVGDGPDGRPSWTQRVLTLRDHEDVGPFRLAFYEALVRLADWRMSADHPSEDA